MATYTIVNKSTGAVLYEANDLNSIAGTDLANGLLRGLNLSGVDMSGCDLTGAVLQSTYCSGTNFSGCTLDGTDFSYSYFGGCGFIDTVENSDVNFKGSDVLGCSFTQTLASYAYDNFDFTNAVFGGGSFSGDIALINSSFDGAKLSGLNLSGITEVSSSTTFVGATFDGTSTGDALHDSTLDRCIITSWTSSNPTSMTLNDCEIRFAASIVFGSAIFNKCHFVSGYGALTSSISFDGSTFNDCLIHNDIIGGSGITMNDCVIAGTESSKLNLFPSNPINVTLQRCTLTNVLVAEGAYIGYLFMQLCSLVNVDYSTTATTDDSSYTAIESSIVLDRVTIPQEIFVADSYYYISSSSSSPGQGSCNNVLPSPLDADGGIGAYMSNSTMLPSSYGLGLAGGGYILNFGQANRFPGTEQAYQINTNEGVNGSDLGNAYMTLYSSNISSAGTIDYFVSGTSFRGATIVQSNGDPSYGLINTKFTGCDFTGADLTGLTNIVNCHFQSCDFSYADLSSLNLSASKFHGCNMHNANRTGVSSYSSFGTLDNTGTGILTGATEWDLLAPLAATSYSTYAVPLVAGNTYLFDNHVDGGSVGYALYSPKDVAIHFGTGASNMSYNYTPIMQKNSNVDEMYPFRCVSTGYHYLSMENITGTETISVTIT